MQHLIQLLKEIEQQRCIKTQSNVESPFSRFTDRLSHLLIEGNQHHSSSWAAHMTGSPNTASVIGLIISALHNGNLLSSRLYPQLAQIESELTHWFKSLYDFPYAHFVSGSSAGVLEALWYAKKQSRTKRKVYASQSCHYSIIKACQLLDLDLELLATEESGKLSISELRKACKRESPLAVIATLGTTSSGLIDAIEECGQVASSNQAWFHVDAAWGGAFIFEPEYKADFSACADYADSMSVDPHKGWQQPKHCSVLLSRHDISTPETTDAPYLETSPQNTLHGSYGGEWFLPLWCDLQLYGQDNLEKRVKQCLKESIQFKSLLSSKPEIQLHTWDTAIVCFSLMTMDKLQCLVDDGIRSTSIINQQVVYRAVFANTQLTATDLYTRIVNCL
jgi:glutamate/tyrosine decarboxylase-like PLP-dependent enzyme